MSNSRLNKRSRLFRAGLAISVGAVVAAIAYAPGANAASVAVTLSAANGPSAGGNALTGTTTTAKFVSGSTFAEFQYAATTSATCATAYTAAVTPSATAGVVVVPATGAGALKILSSMKVAFVVPSGLALVSPATSTAYNFCVYTSTANTGTLLANAKYSIAAAPTISNATPIVPNTGPALGGGTVTVTGTNFVTGLTASLGGVALTGITIASATSFTAVVPAHSAGALNLAVTTTGGTATKTAAYTYTNGIVISPMTATSNNAGTDIDIVGVGFSSLVFASGGSVDDTNSHIYLVKGAYDPTAASSAKTNPELSECTGVLVISDGEMICTVTTTNDLTNTGNAVPVGTYTLTVVTDGSVDANSTVSPPIPYSQSVISSGSTFTVAPY